MVTCLAQNYLSGIKTQVEASDGTTKQMQEICWQNTATQCTDDRIVYAFICFATFQTKVIQMYKLLYDVCNLFLLFLNYAVDVA